MSPQTPIVPRGFQLNEIQNEIKARKTLAEAFAQEAESLFEGKTILIDNSNFGKGLRINIVPESETPSVNSQISKQFLSGDYCLTGVCLNQHRLFHV